MEFTGFAPKDFDAYLDRKWRSNVFNLERLQVKQKLETLGKRLAPRLLTIDGSPLSYQVSPEHPALSNGRTVDGQHLFLFRSEAARLEVGALLDQRRGIATVIEDPSPLHSHIFLAVTLNQHLIEVSLRVHALATVDRENLERRTREFFERQKLLNELSALPEAFSVGLYPTDAPKSVRGLDDESLQRLIGQVAASGRWFGIWTSHARTLPLVESAEFVDLLERQLSAILPIYNFVAWHRDNDFLEIRDFLKARHAKEKARGLLVHDTVRVTRGLFSGHRGVIEEIDGKGVARVRLGKMVVKLSSEDLIRQ